MDNPGWHAQRRANKVCYVLLQNDYCSFIHLKQEDQLYSRDSALLTGHHDLLPMDESLIGGLKRSSLSSPPAVPPKDNLFPSSPSSSFLPSPHATYTPAQLTNMSAVERSKLFRAARMDPHLQVRGMLSLTTPSPIHFDLFSLCAVRCSSVHFLYASLIAPDAQLLDMIQLIITEFGTAPRSLLVSIVSIPLLRIH